MTARRRKTKVAPLEESHKQWELKAGFAPDGRMITLRELVATRAAAGSAAHLTRSQIRDLTLERLRRFPDLSLPVFGRRRPVSQRTAMKEVREGTALGRFLIETEQNIIHLLLERMQRGKGPRTTRRS